MNNQEAIKQDRKRIAKIAQSVFQLRFKGNKEEMSKYFSELSFKRPRKLKVKHIPNDTK